MLRRHPFPEPEGARYVSESYVWRAIDRSGYKTRFVNEVLRIYWTNEEGKADVSTLSRSVLRCRMVVHARTLDDLAPWLAGHPAAFASAAFNLSRYGLQRGMRLPAYRVRPVCRSSCRNAGHDDGASPKAPPAIAYRLLSQDPT